MLQFKTLGKSIGRLLVVGFFSWGMGVHAQGQVTVPYLSGPIIDQSDVLSYEVRERLSAQIRALPKHLLQFQIWITPTLNGESIESVALRAVKEWKLGTTKEDRGLLLLIASKDRQVRFEVGYGLEGDFPDILASRVIDRVLAPRLSRGDYEGGLQEVVSVVSQLTLNPKDSPLRKELSTGRSKNSKKGIPGNLIFIIVVIIVLNLVFGGRRRRRSFGGYGGWGGGGWGGGSGGWGGGSFGGGGGWSGGGGSFGGGGASGRF